MIHPVTLSVCPLRLARRETPDAGSAIATGFLWGQGERKFLVTNWHNVSGMNPTTGQHIGSFTPNYISIGLKYHRKDADLTFITTTYLEVDLYGTNSAPIWLGHKLGHKVDCVAIPLPGDLGADFAGRPLNEIDLERRYQPGIGDDCFVVGFPKGMAGRAKTAIWKRGSVASEPDADHDELPLFLVDTSTREGMSGSPVIVRHQGIFMPNGPIFRGDESIGTVENFAGVYSGRIGDDPLGVQLGRVWKAQVVDEIVSQSALGAHPLDVTF